MTNSKRPISLAPITTTCPNCRQQFTFTPRAPIQVEIHNHFGSYCPACCRIAEAFKC